MTSEERETLDHVAYGLEAAAGGVHFGWREAYGAKWVSYMEEQDLIDYIDFLVSAIFGPQVQKCEADWMLQTSLPTYWFEVSPSWFEVSS